MITEAAAGNMGVVPPVAGFNAALAELCARVRGAVRQRRGDDRLPGQPRRLVRPRRAREGAPDLMTFGKVMGGGFPAAAFGGRGDVMARLAPVGPVYQAGTLSGNPIATTAGLTTLRLATAEVYAPLDETADTSPASSTTPSTAAGVPHVVQAAGNLFTRLLRRGAEKCADYVDRLRASGTLHRFRAFFHAMLDAGVYLPPSAFEAWFVSAAHDDAPSTGSRRAAPCGGGRGGRPAATTRALVSAARRPPSCTCCGTARSTTPTASSTAGSPATT